MQCPKCQAQMEHVEFAGVEVDRCGECGGLWFDMLEHEDLKTVDGSEAIDVGDPETGRAHDELRDINCPVCGEAMTPLRDFKQPHIRLEACTSCQGLYCDAGEFRDFKEESLADVFRDLIARLRSA